MRKNNKKGFTLIELLVSISIIAILVAISSVSFSAAQKKARDSRRMEDVRTVAKAAETYYFLQNSAYPASSSTPWIATLGNNDTVLPIFPTDPKGTGWTAYNYSIMAGGGYCMCAAVEGITNGNASNDTCTFAPGGGRYFCMRNQQ